MRRTIGFRLVDKLIDKETLAESPALVLLKIRSFVLMLLVATLSLTVYISSNLAKGYHKPLAAQFSAIAAIIGLILLLRKGVKRRLIFNLALAVFISYLQVVMYQTADYVRMLPWWGTFLVFAAILAEHAKDMVVWALVLYASAMYSLSLGPDGIFHNGIETITLVFFCAFVIQNYYLKSKTILLDKLNEALGEIKTLHGMLPVCSNCRKIRAEDGGWEQMEAYLSRHSAAKFTHGLCPACVRHLYPELADKILNKEPTTK